MRYRIAAWRGQRTIYEHSLAFTGQRAQVLRTSASLSQMDDAFFTLVSHLLGEDLSRDSIMRQRMDERMTIWEQMTGMKIGSEEFNDMVEQTSRALLS